MQNICVYCASSTQSRPVYFEAAATLGKILAENKLRLIFGGGGRGLMGKIADSILEHGGEAVGVMPSFMMDVEWNHPGVTKMILVDTMHQRKEKLAQMADAIVALPGGCGTMEELLEVITWKRLGIFTQPIIICNVEGYFDPLIAMLERSVEEQFMRPEHLQMWTVVEQPEEVLDAIKTTTQWDKNAKDFAAL